MRLTQALLLVALPFACLATELPSHKGPCDALGFEHIRGSREACTEEHAASVDAIARVYLPQPGVGFLANAYPEELQASAETDDRALLDLKPGAPIRAVILPDLGEAGSPAGFLQNIDLRTVGGVALIAVLLSGIAVPFHARKLLKKTDPLLRRYIKREDPSAKSAFSQALTKRFWISAARSPFDWASKLFHRPNSAHPLSGFRRKSSQ